MVETQGENMRNFMTAAAASMLLAACAAGVNFTKPQDSDLVLGKTTEAEVLSRLGQPNVRGNRVVNGETLKLDTYAYAKVGGAAALPGVTPARSLALVFRDGVLIERAYSSSFGVDSTYFDFDKARSVKQGMAFTDVSGLLGKPSGEAIFPKHQYEYVFTQTKGLRSQRDLLLVEVDEGGMVTNVSFDQTGQL